MIPEVVGPVLSDRDPSSQPWVFPTDCPVCGERLVRDEAAAATHCVNFHCDRQIRDRIEHFVGRYALDIEYLGEKNIDRFVSLGLLTDVADLYTLNFDKVLELDASASRSNLKASIEGSRRAHSAISSSVCAFPRSARSMARPSPPPSDRWTPSWRHRSRTSPPSTASVG